MYSSSLAVNADINDTGLPKPLSEELLTLTCSPVYDVGNERYDVNVSWTINLPTVFTAALHNTRLRRKYRQDKFPPTLYTLTTYPASVPDCDSIPVCDQLSIRMVHTRHAPNLPAGKKEK